MRRIIHYRQGYKIVINDKFYEVSDGKTITHFGELGINQHYRKYGIKP